MERLTPSMDQFLYPIQTHPVLRSQRRLVLTEGVAQADSVHILVTQPGATVALSSAEARWLRRAAFLHAVAGVVRLRPDPQVVGIAAQLHIAGVHEHRRGRWQVVPVQDPTHSVGILDLPPPDTHLTVAAALGSLPEPTGSRPAAVIDSPPKTIGQRG